MGKSRLDKLDNELGNLLDQAELAGNEINEKFDSVLNDDPDLDDDAQKMLNKIFSQQLEDMDAGLKKIDKMAADTPSKANPDPNLNKVIEEMDTGLKSLKPMDKKVIPEPKTNNTTISAQTNLQKAEEIKSKATSILTSESKKRAFQDRRNPKNLEKLQQSNTVISIVQGFLDKLNKLIIEPIKAMFSKKEDKIEKIQKAREGMENFQKSPSLETLQAQLQKAKESLDKEMKKIPKNAKETAAHNKNIETLTNRVALYSGWINDLTESPQELIQNYKQLENAVIQKQQQNKGKMTPG